MPLRDIAGINSFLVDAGAADAENGLSDGHVRPQRNILRRHDGPGGILRIAENFIDLLAHLRVGLGKNSLHDIGRHFFYNIDGVVDIELVDDLFELAVGKAPDKKLLCVRLHLHEAFRSQILRQQPEQKRQAAFVELFEYGGNICGVHGAEKIAQGRIFFIVQQRQKGLRQRKIAFCHVYLSSYL